MPEKMLHCYSPVIPVTLHKFVNERIVKYAPGTEYGVLDTERIPVLKDHDACSGKQL